MLNIIPFSNISTKTVLEAKPTLETALGDSILDIDKLNKICLWVRIPHVYRPIVWKILLGIVPLIKDAWGFVEDQRQEQFKFLREAVETLLVVQRSDREKGGLSDG